ncbi:MAG: NBR1-Ig-like domain-containing protein, partial [Anaerolineales bacterium]
LEESAEAPPELELGPQPEAEIAAEASGGAVSLESLEEERGPGRFDKVVQQASAIFQGRPWLAAVIIGALLFAFLFLPPVSLAERLGDNGYTALDGETASLTHPDGLTLFVDPETEGRLRVRLGSVPQADFLAGEELAEEVKLAQASVPAYLDPKSPYYTIETKGDAEGPVRLEVVIPNGAEPWETLDLYTWDGESWSWLPNTLNRDDLLIVSELETMPASLLVMQSEAVDLTIVTESSDLLSQEVETEFTSVDLVEMKIGTLGAMTGDPARLPPGNVSDLILAPTVRNWAPGRQPNRALVADMLTIEEDRATHLAALTDLVTQREYAGLVLDYRGLTAGEREAYAAFVTDLAEQLHAAEAWLAVTVDAPVRQDDGRWETGGYDWKALGAAVDQVRVVMPLTPLTYAPGGVVEQMLSWATSQVNRYKLYPIFSSMCTDGETTVTLEEVLTSLGEVRAIGTQPETVEPGTQLSFELSGGGQVQTDALTGAALLKTAEGDFWLGTPQWLRARMDLISRYHLGGVLLCDVLAEGNFPGVVDVVGDYETQVATIAHNAPEVVWVTEGPDGALQDATLALRQAQFTWTAPEISGTYRIAANVGGLDRGMVEIEVVAPVAEADEDEEEAALAAAEGEDEEEEEEEEEALEGVNARYVTDVTVPDGTRFDKGEQFTKTWRVRNVGSEAWPEDTVLAFASGSQMTDAAEVEVGEIEPGDEVDVSVELTAPEEDGSYTGGWTLRAGNARIPGGQLTVVIRVGEETQPEAEDPGTTSPPPVTTTPIGGSFELGGHIRDHSIPHGDLMHHSGMNWVKVQVRYPNDARGDIASAHAKGFKIQVSILGPSGMVTEGGFNERVATWAAGIAAAGADAIEVWNEPNIPREWQEGHINPASYTELLCASYSAIKAANPNAAVISAAPAPTGYFGGCYGHGCDDLPWLQGMYNAGAANCMDYIGAHHNSGATAPSATSGHPADPGSTHHSWFFLPQTQLYYNVFGGSRQLFYTELGYVSPEGFGWIPGTFAWGGNTTVAQQAQWLAEVVQLSSQTGMVRAVIVWNVDFDCYGDCGGVQDPQAGYAIIRPDGSCPACETLHALLGAR